MVRFKVKSGVSPVISALAWVSGSPVVTSPIVNVGVAPVGPVGPVARLFNSSLFILNSKIPYYL